MAVLFMAIEARAPDPIIPLAMFRNRMVSTAVLATFFTGFGMFGAIIFIPLFFQVVLGASAISSGNFLTPMMLGIVAGTIIGGQTVSPLGGHYRREALIGLGLMGLGMFLLSRMSLETSFGEAVFYITLMGLGLGITLPLYTIAVQNTVPRQIMGVATSSLQFFRTIGGTLGLAILGSVLNNRFSSHLGRNIPQSVKEVLPEGVLSDFARNPQALINPVAHDQLKSVFDSVGLGNDLLLQQFTLTLRSSLASAIDDLFLISLAAVVAAWLVSTFMKESSMLSGKESASTENRQKLPANEGPIGTIS